MEQWSAEPKEINKYSMELKNNHLDLNNYIMLQLVNSGAINISKILVHFCNTDADKKTHKSKQPLIKEEIENEKELGILSTRLDLSDRSYEKSGLFSTVDE